MVKSVQSSSIEKSSQLAKTRRQAVRDKVSSAAKTVKSAIGRAAKKTVGRISIKGKHTSDKDKLIDNVMAPSATGTVKITKSKSRIRKIGSGIASSARSVKGAIGRAGTATKNKAMAAGGAIKNKAVAAGGAVKTKAMAAGGAIKTKAVTAGKAVKRGASKVGSAVKGGIKRVTVRKSGSDTQKTPKAKSNNSNILSRLRNILRPSRSGSVKHNQHNNVMHNNNLMENKMLYADTQNSINSGEIQVQGTKQSINQKKSI